MLYLDVILFVTLTIFFLRQLGLKSADNYLTLVTVTVVLLFFGFLFFKEIDFIRNLFPVNQSIDKDILVRFLGILIVFVIFSGTVFGFYSFNPLLIAPLAQFTTSTSQETFAAIKAAADPNTYAFIVTLGASRVEEISLGLGFVLAGIFGTYLFYILYEGIKNKNTNPFQLHHYAIKHKLGLFIGGIALSIFYFIILHIFNGTYVDNPELFLYAGIFRLVLNILIYKFTQLGLYFSISIHEVWNGISIGISEWAKFLFMSPGGLLYLVFNVALLYFLIVRYKFAIKEFLKIITFRSRFIQ